MGNTQKGASGAPAKLAKATPAPVTPLPSKAPAATQPLPLSKGQTGNLVIGQLVTLHGVQFYAPAQVLHGASKVANQWPNMGSPACASVQPCATGSGAMVLLHNTGQGGVAPRQATTYPKGQLAVALPPAAYSALQAVANNHPALQPLLAACVPVVA